MHLYKTRRNDLDDALLVEVCDRFLSGERAVDTARWLSDVLGREVKRESVYPMITRAKECQLLRIVPPRNRHLQRELANHYGVKYEELHVVDAQGTGTRDLIAEDAAAHIVELIDQVAARKRRVRICLGGGGAVGRVARKLAGYLRNRSDLPALAFHAMSPGFDVENPRTAPLSFFGFFDDVPTDIDYVGLFAPAFADADVDSYARLTGQYGVAASFARKDEIDIVVTSCARAGDPHGELNRFMDVASEVDQDDTSAALREAGLIGDVTYRPYSKEGPILLAHGKRAVTLFEIEDLVKLARKKHKHVVLLAAPCGMCRSTKEEALRPLLAGPPGLKLWNHVFLDKQTAQALLPAGA